MERFRNIVAAIDFSETSGEVVRTALALVRDDGHVCLLHAVPHAIQTPWVVDASGADVNELQRQWVAEAEMQLITLAATMRLDPRRVSVEVLVGPAAFEIVRHAGERGADLIVVGSHGRGALRRFLLGSVAERVLREAGCPVMIVPDRALRVTATEVRTLRTAAAGARGADLLVLGSHGHGVIRRFLLGSVAERVLREAGCPVMIVPDRVFRATAVEALALRGAGSGNVA